MAIKLNTTSGSVTLDAEDGSGNVDITVPRAGFIESFVLEDDANTEVSVGNAKEVKFIGSGITTTWTNTSPGTDGDPYDLTFTIDAAQTGITSIYATDLILGEDTQTAIDFGTPNEIDFKVDNAARLTMTAGALYPVTTNQIDLGTASLEFKDAFFDGTVTADAFAGPLTGNVTGNVSGTAGSATGNAATATALATARTIGGTSFDGTANIVPGTATLATTATVTDSTANTDFPVVFHDESNGLLDDTGALRYNPSTGQLLVPNLTVAGTTTQVNTVTMNAQNAVVFEGATADNYETTLSIVDPTADHTQYLINQGGYVPVLAAATTTAITSTPEELNLLDGVSGLVQADLTKLAAVDATAAELNILDGVTSTAAELNILDGVTSTAAELNLLDGLTEVGYKNIPQNSQSANYTLVLADSGKHIHHPTSDTNARTWTIPANSSVAYPIGTAITFTNRTSQVISIAITSDTMYLAGDGNASTRALAQYGMATALKVDSTVWFISGLGLT